MIVEYRLSIDEFSPYVSRSQLIAALAMTIRWNALSQRILFVIRRKEARWETAFAVYC